MQNHHNYMKITSLEFVFGAGLGLLILCTIQVSAQPLTKDTLTGNVTEVDISIDPAEPLPAKRDGNYQYRRCNRYRYGCIST